jgi:hypothetical protein
MEIERIERPKRNIKKKKDAFVNSVILHVGLHYSQIQDKSILHLEYIMGWRRFLSFCLTILA